MVNFGFLIPTHISTQESLDTFRRCIDSLDRFHPDIPKILFYDPVMSYDISTLDFVKNNKSITTVKTRYCQGELNVYKHYYENKYFDMAVILHDSFELKKTLTNLDDIKDINYIWYFTNHRVHWHTITEDQTEYNIKNSIKTHDDLILHIAQKSFDNSSDFYKYFIDIYHRKNEWIGCYGSISILRHDFLLKLEEKTKIFKLLPHMVEKRNRITLESIITIAFQYTLGKTPDVYDGLYYDGVKTNSCETDTFKKKHFYR
jgi:hypothetical protein